MLRNLASLDPPGTVASAHNFAYDGKDRLAIYAPPALSGVGTPTRYTYHYDGQITEAQRPDDSDVHSRAARALVLCHSFFAI